MAKICPSLPPRSAFGAGAYVELELLQTLERELPGAYILFHGVDWSRGFGTHEQHGEVDIVVVNQAGETLLIEVKAGDVEFRPDGIFKRYGAETKNVTRQAGLQYGALRTRLQDASLPAQLHHLLVLPQLRLSTETVMWPRERIVDSADLPGLASRIVQSLGPGASDTAMLERVLAFFQNRFRVEPDVSALAGRLQQSATRMAAGLATWVPRITVPSGVIRVAGTAGSGKTQLALRMLRDADAAGQRASYICFNRALADHMARVVPVRVQAQTFHEYATRVARESGQVVDFELPGAFDALANICIDHLASSEPNLDLLVLDEMQDLQPAWVQAMLGRLRPDGHAVLLEDPDQQLYPDREAFDIVGAVGIRSHENFRSPRALVRLINGLRLTDGEIEALSDHDGDIPDPIVYATPERIAPCTVSAVERCLQRGFALDDIAVVSMRGRERSLLQRADMLGPWTLRRFTGRFDEGGSAVWTDGALLVDSVRRFKGQAAAAVVLTECDLSTFDPISRRLLFVGLTRARMHMEWVISKQTESLLGQTLANA